MVRSMELGKSAEACGSGCSGCVGEPTRAAPRQSVAEPGPRMSLYGGRLVAASMGLFLGPLVLAVVGASCFDPAGGWQLLGAVAGLSAGMAASVAAARILARLSKEAG